MKLTFLFILLPFYLYCQNSDGEVIYSCYVSNGGYYKSSLIFLQSESLYKEMIKRDGKKVSVKTDEEKNEVNLRLDLDSTIPEALGMYTNLKENVIIENLYLPTGLSNKNDTLFVKDKARIIDWEISEETKKIAQFICQKAIGKFRGRVYNVWFANEIPVSFGPWKINGLPGLILEAQDETKTFMFFADVVTLNKAIEINPEKFNVKRYNTPIEKNDKIIAMYKKIAEDISMKIRTSMPREVKITSSKTQTKGLGENDFIEKSFDDLK